MFLYLFSSSFISLLLFSRITFGNVYLYFWYFPLLLESFSVSLLKESSMMI